MKLRTTAIATASVFAVAGTMLAGAAPASAGQRITVELLIVSEPVYASSRAQAVRFCKMGINDYDIAKGDQIKLLSGEGDIVGLGRLSTVKVVKSSGDFYCYYKGTVNADYSKYYSVEIDGRGGPDYTYNEIRNDGWKIELTI